MHAKKDPSIVDRLRKLVEEGRLDIVNGGFVAADQATCTADDLLSNFQFGRHWSNNNLGTITDTLWSVDQFGQSLSFAKIGKLIGFSRQVFARMSLKMQQAFKSQSSYLFNWKLTADSSDKLMCSKMPDHYEMFAPFRVDRGLWNNLDSPPTVSMLSGSFDLPAKIEQFLHTIQSFESWYLTKHIMVPFGGDFWFSNYDQTIQTMDALVIFVNSNNLSGRFAGKFAVRPSTAKDYFEAVEADLRSRKVTLPIFD